MSLTAIKDRLISNLGTVQGVQRVYDDMPGVSPAGADLPAIIVARQHPFVSIEMAVVGSDEYTWHFDLLFLFKVSGEATEEEWDSGIEPFFRRVRDVLNDDYNLGQTNTSMTLTTPADVDWITYRTGLYWGFRMSLDVQELVTDTVYTLT